MPRGCSRRSKQKTARIAVKSYHYAQYNVLEQKVVIVIPAGHGLGNTNMPKTLDIVIEADAQFTTGYALCMDDYRGDFVEGRDRFKSVTSFRFIGVRGEFLARQELRGGNRFWYGFQRFGKHVRKTYIAKHDRMTLERMEEAAERLYDDVTQWLARQKSHTVPTPKVVTSDWLTPPSRVDAQEPPQHPAEIERSDTATSWAPLLRQGSARATGSSTAPSKARSLQWPLLSPPRSSGI